MGFSLCIGCPSSQMEWQRVKIFKQWFKQMEKITTVIGGLAAVWNKHSTMGGRGSADWLKPYLVVDHSVPISCRLTCSLFLMSPNCVAKWTINEISSFNDAQSCINQLEVVFLAAVGKFHLWSDWFHVANTSIIYLIKSHCLAADKLQS